jgi:hypothetical protein
MKKLAGPPERSTIMKVVLTLFLAAVISFPLAGCFVQSLNPYYTKESVSVFPGIAGEWTLVDERGMPRADRPWAFAADKISTYDKNGTSGTLKVVYFRIGESFFLDTTVDEPGAGTTEWWTMHVFPAHLLTKAEIRDGRLMLIPLDYGVLEEAMRKGAVKLPHIRPKDEDAVLFTASSEEWMDFLKKNLNDPVLFSEKNALRFVRHTEGAGKAP